MKIFTCLTTLFLLMLGGCWPSSQPLAGPWMNDAVLDNQYKYNGKKLNGDFGLNWMDYGARWYDGTLGRWWSVDLMAEITLNISPYSYALNNPVILVDIDGMFTSIIPGIAEQYGEMDKVSKRSEIFNKAVYMLENKEPNKKVRITITGEIAKDADGEEVSGLLYSYPDRYPSDDDYIYYKIPYYKLLIEGIEVDENGVETVVETLEYQVVRFGVKYKRSNNDESPSIVSIENSSHKNSDGSSKFQISTEMPLTWAYISTTMYHRGWNIFGPYYIHVGPPAGHAMGAVGCIEICGGSNGSEDFNSDVKRLSGINGMSLNVTYTNITVKFLSATQPQLIDSGLRGPQK